MNIIKIPEGVEELKISQESGRVVIEFVPEFKKGDFVTAESTDTCIYHSTKGTGGIISYAGTGKYSTTFETAPGWGYTKHFRLATEEEKQKLLDALKRGGKRWNAEKLCIEDIPKSNTPEQGKLAIFWDRNRKSSYIRLYKGFTCGVHCDNDDICWDNAIKFESQEQFEKHIKQ